MLEAAREWGVPPDTIFDDLSRREWFFYWREVTIIRQQAQKDKDAAAALETSEHGR